ncbi:hypothetical protein [Bradyrhizobium sp. WYCCWR 12699]|uniref:hypothetical protein n=1 Tax=Bradyrhizobium sp. WYCCWR 12699 TaxID=3064203 RepID=UPI0028A401C2|nr:hypothetical protein [Bradyrhizobium sp. WYCCWR 12699]MDT4739271.1 hypothetical protein [Bradyrhizobium sp. WYCCWR 12699]
MTTEDARSTIVRRQQEDHDGESEEEEKQDGQKGQEGCSGEENRKEGSQEVREEVCQKICQEICQEIEEGCPQEGWEEGRQDGSEEVGQEGREESRQAGCTEEGGTEEGEGSSRAEAVSTAACSGSRARAGSRDKLGDAFVFCGSGAGRGAELGPSQNGDRQREGRCGDAAAFLHRHGLPPEAALSVTWLIRSPAATLAAFPVLARSLRAFWKAYNVIEKTHSPTTFRGIAKTPKKSADARDFCFTAHIPQSKLSR